ncbi:hypothetical protein TNCV_2678901 [Trichonephila clavipes]|nr:hypothetical protein TNCV_2678901 [Trichonephila clavipes]
MRPILAYASPVWGYAAKTHINILDTLQNSLIRMIVKATRYMYGHDCPSIQDIPNYFSRFSVRRPRDVLNRGEKDEKKDQYLKSLPRRGRLEEENGRTRTKLEYVTRSRMVERRKGSLSAPKRVRGAPRTQWEGKCCYFFLCASGMKKKRVCKEKLTDATAGVTKLEPALTLIPVL